MQNYHPAWPRQVQRYVTCANNVSFDLFKYRASWPRYLGYKPLRSNNCPGLPSTPAPRARETWQTGIARLHVNEKAKDWETRHAGIARLHVNEKAKDWETRHAGMSWLARTTCYMERCP